MLGANKDSIGEPRLVRPVHPSSAVHGHRVMLGVLLVLGAFAYARVIGLHPLAALGIALPTIVPLSAGEVRIFGRSIKDGRARAAYVPQDADALLFAAQRNHAG